MFLDFCGVTGVGGWFGMGDWVLTQGFLLCWDDNFWGGCFGMGDLFLTQRSSFVGMTRFGWVVGLEWVICFLRRGPSFVGMTILGGWRAY